MTDTATRETTLQRAIADAALEGWTIQTVTPGVQAILQRRVRVKWFTMVLLGIITFGIFFLVVLFRIVNRKTETLVLTVDDRGRIRKEKRRA
jgi:ABC-type transport system involved in cytochrome c biogenesis permease component